MLKPIQEADPKSYATKLRLCQANIWFFYECLAFAYDTASKGSDNPVHTVAITVNACHVVQRVSSWAPQLTARHYGDLMIMEFNQQTLGYDGHLIQKHMGTMSHGV